MSTSRARDALLMAESDPGRSVALAADVSRLARAEHDPEAGSIAERAWGLAAHHLEDIDLAVRHLRRAIQLGSKATAPQLEAEARMTLAGVLSWRGRARDAVREVDIAVAGLSGVQRARALGQRGAILHHLGRFDEAMDSYRAALPALRRAGDQVWVQRVLQNRGVAHAQRQEFAAAEADLRAAEAICRDLGLGLLLGHVHQNLGFVFARRGDVPAALDYLDRAETRFRLLNSQIGKVLADRAGVLLSVRLVSEARAAADAAVQAFEREGRGLALPEARLLLAQAALLDGDLRYAEEHARRTVREFGQRREWAALGRLALLTCRLHDPDPGQRRTVRVSELDRMAELLAGTWPAAAMEARLAAAKLAIERRQVTRGRALLGLAARGRRRGVATLRARAWYAEALLRQAGGNRPGARSAARAGLRILDEHVAGLGATDLRARAAGHRVELAELGLRIALQERRPARVFEWAELGRASHLAYPPARPPKDRVLATALTELRGIAAEIDRRRKLGLGTGALPQQQVALEREIRDHCRRRAAAVSTDATAPLSIGALGEALRDAALVEFIRIDGTLRVLTVVDGRVRLRPLGQMAAIVDLVEALPFAMRRLARRTIRPRSRAAADALLRSTANELDRALFGPLPEVGDRPLVVIPTGELQSMPWSILPTCHGRPVTVAPSATLWWAARRRRSSRGRIAVAAGPNLPGAQDEAGAVAEIHHTTALTGTEATVDAVAGALDGAALAHLATHGQVNQDNPLFSMLRFADGPLMLHDLEALDRVPHTVVLAACDTGRAVVHSGDEVLGLGATLLAQGASQLIAPVLSVLDVETAPLMVTLHRQLARGRPAAEALAEAQREIAAELPTGLADAAPFICLGAGFTTPDLAAA